MGSGDPTTTAAALGALRLALARAGYTRDGLREALGRQPSLGRLVDREVYLRRLGDDDRSLLARLFALEAPVPRARLARLVDVDALGEAGVIEVRPREVHPLVRIDPTPDGLLLLADRTFRRPQPAEQVAPWSAAAELLASVTPRRNVGTALDLGTGGGVQALLAATHSEQVTATDVSPRALRLAAMNARLNDVANVELLEGSWLEPVAGLRFDLVVANPPYVVSPDTTLTYRDGGLARDEVSLMLLRAIPEHLEQGGIAVLQLNWIHEPDGEWREPLETVLRGCGCDSILLRYGQADPSEYAAVWNLLAAEADPPQFSATVDRWLAYYRRERIDAISFGVAVLRRRRATRNWRRALEVPGRPTRRGGEHVLRLLGGYDEGRRTDEPAGRLVDGARVVRRTRVERGRPVHGPARVELAEHVGFSVSVPAEAGEALASSGRLDGGVEARRLLRLGFLDPG